MEYGVHGVLLPPSSGARGSVVITKEHLCRCSIRRTVSNWKPS
jgi:hypothetical protein